jgi:hypothetical protein
MTLKGAYMGLNVYVMTQRGEYMGINVHVIVASIILKGTHV